MILKSFRREVLCPTVIILVVLTIFPTSADPIPVTSTLKIAESTTSEPESISTTALSANTSLTTTTSTSTSTITTTTSKPPPPKRIINVSDAPVGISVASPEEVEQLPKSFDGRAVWSHCPSLRHVSDQGSCGGCWAVVTTDVAADRLCIASNGTIKTRLSPMHLLQCCGRGDCNDGIVDFGACAGGDPWGTWRYFSEHGVVSARCKPYPRWVKWMGIATFEEGNLDGPEEEEAARCRKQCAGNSSLDFEEELYFGRDYYRLPVDEGTIRKEIFENGPVVTHISINDPEMDTHRHDGSVIYRCPKSVGMATHGVRLIGWGEEKKDPASAEDGRYWLAVNSWSRSWGNNGTFRIARGSNSCHVEEFVSTLLVKV